ncbi:MAG TPA: FAD-dependent oxidoreductase [Streptosporangiaceae bacterium]|nr:FAD-dependent oxidoreductase [Streptosporangiaceae bacterium]
MHNRDTGGRNGDVSFWWRAGGGFPARRPSLPEPAEADVCVVGAGFTGLWTAYYLKRADPSLRIIVLEAAFAGFGASGRNGGWLTAALPGSRERYARGPGGRAAVLDLERQLRATVDEVAAVCAAEGIDADLVKGGELAVATTPAQHERLREELAAHRRWGLGEDEVGYLGPAELAGRVRIPGGAGALYLPQCARIQPAKLVTGLAGAVERSGVQIYEATPVTRIVPGRGLGGPDSARARACTVFGDVTAGYVLRATEGFTTRLPGRRRDLLPMNSSMIVTEPLGDDVWEQIGWSGCETIGDSAHVYMYAQRTADGRIAIGGRGVPYRFGSALDDRGTTQPETVAILRRVLSRLFPAAASARIDHAWCGVLGVPRDWCATVTLAPSSGLGWAGGYTGHGVAASNLAGRTLADLVLGADTPRTSLPWVGHRSRRWEPEPLRWAGVHGLYAMYRAADRAEDRGSPRTSPLARIGDRISGRAL